MSRSALAFPTTPIEAANDIAPVEQRVGQGEGLLQRGQYDAALAVADALLAQSTGLPAAWLLRGTACRHLLRFAEAAEAFQFILTLFPDFTLMYLNLANALIELGRLPEAECHLREAIARRPEFAAAHASLGSLYMRMDRSDLAEAPTRRALALNADLVAAHQNLAAILALRGGSQVQAHRDAAYRRQQIFIESAPSGTPTVLILTSSGSGNVPYLHLLPRERYKRVLWHLEYAPDGQQQLPPHDFVFNAIGDPDAAARAQICAEDFAARCTRPIINRPDRVARTLRSTMPDLIGPVADAVVPKTKRFERGQGDMAAAIIASALTFPLILRPAGRHGGEGVQLVRSPADLAARMPDCETLYVTEFFDYRAPDIWYRKYRMIFVDRKPYPYHLAIGARWLLHYKTADMQAGAARRAEEAAFLRDPKTAIGSRAMAALWEIAARLDLDYAGIDFSLLPDGRLLFFEANATMLIHPEEDPLFAYKNAAVGTIVEAVEQMIVRRLAR